MEVSINEERIKKSESHKYVNNVLFRICKICCEWKEANLDNFYKDKNTADRLNTWCKDCARKKAKILSPEKAELKRQKEKNRYYENREHLILQMRNYRINNLKKLQEYHSEYIKRDYVKEKAKVHYQKRRQHKKHNITDNEWINCKNYFNHECAYCGISEIEAINTQGHVLHKEHAINDGANDLSNCIPSCRVCNSEKALQDYNYWYPEKSFTFTEERFDKINKWLNSDYLQFKE